MNYIKSFFDISKINNIDVLCLEKQCAKAAHTELTCCDTHACVRYKGESRPNCGRLVGGWNAQFFDFLEIVLTDLFLKN